MPYKSEAQRKFFNANRKRLEADGVDVDEWNESSRGKELPSKIAELGKLAAQSRCWKGYEPVPGKAPYSDGSCRPKQPKKKQPEKAAATLGKLAASAAWTRSEGKSESGGLNAKGRASLNAEGRNIKPPVTEDNPTGDRAKRKASFCARMSGMKKKLTSEETANDPDSRINKALRKWNC